MRQLNVPKKFTSAGQLWLNLFLILLATIFAFTPIVSLNMEDNDLWQGVQEGLVSMADGMPELAGLALARPEDNIGVTSGKIVTSVSIVGKLISVGVSAAQHDAEAEQKAQELRDLIASQEGQEAIIMTVAIFSQLVDFGAEEGEEAEESSGIGMVIETILKFLIILYLLIFIAAFPYVMLIVLIINALRALRAIKSPELAAGKVGGVMVTPFALALTLTFVLTFLPGFEWGAGLTVAFIASVISIAANTVLTRLRAYNSEDFKYVNLVQGAALLQGIGFIVFFMNLVKTNLLFDFFTALGKYIIDAEIEIAAVNVQVSAMNQLGGNLAKASIGASFVPDLLLMFVFFILSLGVIATITNAVINRLTLTAGKKAQTNATFTAAITAIITAVLPMIVSKLESKRTWKWNAEGTNWLTEKAGTLFEVSADNQAALTGMLIGGIIMLAGAIAFVVAKSFLCPNIAEVTEVQILEGKAADYVEGGVAPEAAPAEDAPVEEAAEEAPVEEKTEA